MNEMNDIPQAPQSEFLFFQTEDGRNKIEVRFEGETVWLSQKLIAELYQVSIPTINEHIKTIYADAEQKPGATIRKFLIVQKEGERDVSRVIDYYNLDMILTIGYRVRSARGVEFRRWATERLHEYIEKGFVLNDDQLKQAGGGRYFDELLERIRDIRSSEKVFWRKVLDIYATSIDYDPREEISKKLFASVQNKMHWGAHGHTAAEIIVERADANRPNMGLTNWNGKSLRKSDALIAKNYLNDDELDSLNRIVTAYLEFAELQAKNRKPMYMADWISKLDDFLRLSEREVLTNAGKISHELATKTAECEYEKYHNNILMQPSRAEKDFEEAIAKIKKLPSNSKTGGQA